MAKEFGDRRIRAATASNSSSKAGSAGADALIVATNAFDADAAVTLFSPDAIIDDPSMGLQATLLGSPSCEELETQRFQVVTIG